MEIRIERRLTGQALREEILQRHGSRQALVDAAEAGDTAARSDLADLRLLEEDPRRLQADHHVESVLTVAPEELDRLTPKRLALLEFLAEADRPYNVTELAGALGRDKKNVSEDLQILEDLGLVESVRRGREKLTKPRGNDIHIVLGRG